MSRLLVITKSKMATLGIFAHDVFLEHVLIPDENGQYDALQTFELPMLDKAKTLPVTGGITEQIKNSIIESFEELQPGDRFLCVGDWLFDFKSEKAKWYWEVVRILNENKEMSLQDASEMAKANLYDREG